MDDLQSLLDNLPYIVARFDRELRHVFVNAAVERVTGLPASDFLGKTNEELGMPLALCTRWNVAIQTVFDSGQSRELEFAFRNQDGNRIFHSRLVPEYGSAGAITFVLSSTQDITDLRYSQEQFDALLQERDAVLRSFYDSSPLMMGVVEVLEDDIRHLSDNHATASLLGATPEALRGRLASELGISESTRRTWIEAYKHSRRTGKPFQFDYTFQSPSGMRWFSATVSPISSQNNTHFSYVVKDATEHKETERVLRESEELFRSAIDAMHEGFILQNIEGKILICNQSAERILGLPSSQMIGFTSSELRLNVVDKEGKELPDEAHPIVISLRTGVPLRDVEVGIQSPDTSLTWLSINSSPLFHTEDPKPYAAVATFADITDRKHFEQSLQAANEWLTEANEQLLIKQSELTEAYARLADLATRDSLTGLKNHRAFQERLVEELKRGARYYTPLSLLMIDVDHFKQLNDKFGHPVGDEALKEIAKHLLSCIRDTDMAARYGGEEFVVLLPHTDLEAATIVAERIRTAIAAQSLHIPPITVSIGLAALQDENDSPALLIERADKALYLAKANGRNCVYSVV